MMNVGKNAPKLIERHTTFAAPDIIPGNGIAIEDVEGGHVIHCTVSPAPAVNLIPVQENLAGIQAVVEAQASEIASILESFTHIGSKCDDAFANQDNDIAILMAEIQALKQRPAQQILTRTVEKPGMTVHEVKVVEQKVPLWVIGVIVAQAIVNVAFMVAQ
jgi:hypothetical protein